MNENDYLFYSYTGNWDRNTLKYTENYPYSIILHPQTHRIMHNGIMYGSGEGIDYFIKGNNESSDSLGVWTGSHAGISEYKEGLTVIYIPNIAGNTTQVTLNINGLGARNVYFNNDQPLKTQYSVGTPILLTYVMENGTGKWKRADSDTLDTPIAPMNSGEYYLTLSNINSGNASTLYSSTYLKYTYSNQTLSCTKFKGAFEGNLTGNASTATKLYTPRTLWSQSFDGSANVTGNIANTGHITSLANNTYDIGTVSNYYRDIYAHTLHGKAEAVTSYVFNNTTDSYAQLYLLGHTSAAAGSDSGKTGRVNYNPNFWITEDNILVSPRVFIGGTNTNDIGNNELYVNGEANIYSTLYTSNKSNVFGSSSCGIGVTNPQSGYRLHIYGNTLVDSGFIKANSFIKSDGSADTVLVSNGTIQKFTSQKEASTLVLRDANSNIYGARYYTDINVESITPEYVYVGTSSDTGIHKVSKADFIDSITENKLIELPPLSLKPTTDWQDTGIIINNTNFPGGNGTYVIQVDATSVNNSTDLYPAIYSGIMSIYNPTDWQTESEEVLLHCAGKANMKRLYIRTKPTLTSNDGVLKIEIASSINFGSYYSFKFKFKKLI